MIRRSTCIAGATALAFLFLPLSNALAQQQVPAAPPQDAPAASQDQPAAPAPKAPVFPKPDPVNFTAPAPTPDAVNAFLKTSWGYDTDRIWQVQAILKTAVDGISKVVVLIGSKNGNQKPAVLQFFALPDGTHIIAGEEILPFGPHPYAGYRAMLQEKADGPYRGNASKDLELVEFADFQCPHCKEAQANMDKLAVDFPKARIVFQNYPLVNIHPSAMTAAEYGACVTKLGGSTAFFQFANAVFDGQEGLATADGATLTLNSAVSKSGLDAAKAAQVAACTTTPEIVAQVTASVKLAQALNINQTPTLMVNGRQVPIGGLPYETLKQIVEYQEKQDGITQ